MKAPSTDPLLRGKNMQQIANRYAHRPEVRDLGWWFYMQRDRIAHRWDRAVLRVERRKAALPEISLDKE